MRFGGGVDGFLDLSVVGGMDLDWMGRACLDLAFG